MQSIVCIETYMHAMETSLDRVPPDSQPFQKALPNIYQTRIPIKEKNNNEAKAEKCFEAVCRTTEALGCSSTERRNGVSASFGVTACPENLLSRITSTHHKPSWQEDKL